MIEQLEPLPEITPNDKILILPSWCDPGFIMSRFQATPTVITLAPTTVLKVAANNPKRWAIGFQDKLAGPSQPRVGITPQPFDYGHIVDNTLTNSWFTLFKYGPMICQEWYAFSTAGGDFAMYELELQ